MSNINLGNTIPRATLVHEWLGDGNGNDTVGTLNLTATNITWTKNTKGYQAQNGSFNGSTSTLNYTTATTLGIANSFTVSQWIYPTKNNGECFEYRNYNVDTNNLIDCYLNTDATPKMILGLYNSSGTQFKNYTTSFTFALNTWHYITISWDGTNLKFYKNNIEDTSMTKTTDNAGTMTDSTRKIWIGNNVAVNTFFGGNILLTRLYSSALSQDEIQLLYQEGLRKLGPSNIRAYPKLLDGLVGYWDFRGTAHNLVDGTVGTVTGATLTTDRFGNSNSAYNFSGTSQYINLPTEITNALTIAWRGTIVDNSYANGMLFTRTGSYNYIGQMFGNNFYMDLGGGNVLLTTGLTSADNNVYHDWVLTKTPGTNTYVLYKDGIQVGSGSSTLTLNFGGIAYRRFGNDYFYKGKLDYILTLNRGLTTNEVSQLYNLTSQEYIYPSKVYDLPNLRDGLVLDLNEQGKDLSGNGNNGTLVNSPAVVRQGKAKGLSYNGSNQCQNITNNGFGITSDYTLSAWIKCTTLNSQANILSKDGPVGGRDWQFRGNSDGTLSFFRGDSSNGTLSDITTSGYTINDGKYHLVVARFSSSGGSQILIDGIVRATSGVLTSKNISSSNCQIGARGDSLYFFTGNIISPRIRNRALSAKEIQALYFSSKGNYIY